MVPVSQDKRTFFSITFFPYGLWRRTTSIMKPYIREVEKKDDKRTALTASALSLPILARVEFKDSLELVL